MTLSRPATTLRAMSRRTIFALTAAGAAVIAASLIALTALSGASPKKPSAEAAALARVEAAVTVDNVLKGIPQHGNVLGNPKAPVTLVEYADLQCPYCARFSMDEFPSLVRDYVRDGRVRVVFQGLSFVGPDSLTALETALSAGSQKRMWNVVELLYANQGTENTGWVSEDLLRGIGKAVPGLNIQAMLAGRSASSIATARAEAQASATEAGVTGTPTFAVGKTRGVMSVVASNDAQTVRAALDDALAR
jgi:protein-disulfide isomerase